MFILKSPKIYVSLASVSIAGKFLFRVSRKLFWEDDLQIISTTLALVLGKRVSKKILLFFTGKYCFWM